MFPEDLQAASWRGAFFFVTSTTREGGRKTASKEFVNSDLRVVEDLGKRQPTFTLEGTIAQRTARDGTVITTYQEMRRQLLEALEDTSGPGVLVHPFYGRLENVVSTTYNIGEQTTLLGDASVSITFEISNFGGQPVPEANVLSSIQAGATATFAAVNTDTAANFSVTAAFTGNFSDALAKGNEIVDEITSVTEPLDVEASALDEFSADLAEFSANLATLVADPQELSDAVGNLLSNMNGVFGTFNGTLDAFIGLFDYGSQDIAFNANTAGLIERQANRDALNANMRAQALAYAYQAAAQATFETVEDIDEVSQTLEDQFQALRAEGILGDCTDAAIVELRVTVLSFFDSQRVSRPRIITVRTAPTSARLLAFQYYGSSELGETIGKINGLFQYTLIEGDVQILSVV